jgi:cytochrome c biogenesis protein CcdA
MSAKNGAWCIGCCWALMASLFAPGAMSVSWMAFVAAIIAVEKTVPWRQRVVTYATAAVLLVLGILVLAVPDALPALTTSSGDAMHMADRRHGSLGSATISRSPATAVPT